MKFLKTFAFASISVISGLLYASCDCHHFDEPDPGMAVGDLLCTDGEVISFANYLKSGKEAVAIIYYVNPDVEAEIRGYAVYLGDISDEAFSDTINTAQGTSTQLYELDGNENTYSLFKCEDAASPMALPVFDLWTYGQSAYIPSVAQLRQIQLVKDFINPRIEAIGGDELPDAPDDCWYWSSTEVEGQEDLKAWLVSMHSGIIQETPKDQKHHCRPVVTIYRHNNHKDGAGQIDDEVLNSFRTDLRVNLVLDRTMIDYALVDSLDFSTKASTDWGIRYCVAAYRRDDTTPYDMKTTYDGYVDFSLPAGKYSFVAWADPVPDYSDKSYYFHTDDFSEIMWRHKYDYEANDYGKAAYRGSESLRVAYTTKDLEILLKPAVARYRLVTLDTPNFTPGKVLVSYYNLPASVEGLTGVVNSYWSDVSFTSTISGTEIAFDHVLAENHETTVNACVEIYDTDNNLRARVRNVGIPVINGGVTTLRGNFYSTLQIEDGDTEGGVVIDPDFEDDIIIEY